jgi:hypothetical protein
MMISPDVSLEKLLFDNAAYEQACQELEVLFMDDLMQVCF